MHCTPMDERASRTSSSLNGLMIAVTSFIFPLLVDAALRSERVRHEGDEAVLAPVLALDRVCGCLGVGALVVRARVESAAEVVGRAQLPHRVREEIVVLVRLVAEDAVDGELLHHGQRVVHRDRKSTRLNSSHQIISYAVFCLKKKNSI